MRRATVVAAVAIVLAGCGSLLPPAPGESPYDVQIRVANGTELDVTVVVNGTVVGEAPAQADVTIGPEGLPTKPWSVEARSPSGRILLSFTVIPGQVTRTTAKDGSVRMSGAGSRADLMCGRLDVFVGPPMLGPVPGPGVAGDCEP
jgi:hypothetical protein